MLDLKALMPEKIPSFGALLYSMFPARMFQPHYAMIAREISFRPGGTLLDIGTGPGLLPVEIAKIFPSSRIVGIDVSQKMIEIAKKNRHRLGAQNAEFAVMDANTLAFNDASFDMIISTGSLHHWKGPVRIIDEIYRCLKVGAEAWIYDGYAEATYADIRRCTKQLFLSFPPAWLVKRILRIHGFTRHEYDTLVKEIIARTPFKTCAFENRGIMMRLILKKNDT